MYDPIRKTFNPSLLGIPFRSPRRITRPNQL
jgi:hypothetical protein